METLTLPHLPGSPLEICLFNDVQNSAFLRQQLLEGNTDFEYAFLDASVLLSRTHVLAACFRAITDSLNNRLKSRNVHSEIVFALSANNNVSPGRSKTRTQPKLTHIRLLSHSAASASKIQASMLSRSKSSKAHGNR